MASLPALNTDTAQGNLSIGNKRDLLQTLAEEGKIRVLSYGNIIVNNNDTATREGSSGNIMGTMAINLLSEIRNQLMELNSNIAGFIDNSTRAQEIAQNFLEAQAKDVEDKTDDNPKYNFNKSFEAIYTVLGEMNKSLTVIAGKGGGFGSGVAGGFAGGMAGGFGAKLLGWLGSAFKFLIRKSPILIGAYVVSQLLGSKSGQGLIDSALKEFDSVVKSFEGDDGNEGGGELGSDSPATHEGGERGSPESGTGERGTATRTTSNGGHGELRQGTASRQRFNNDSSIATDSDLAGLTFAKHPGNPDRNIKKSLAQRLQHIRRKLGKDLYITSGFRTFEHDKKVHKGKVTNSQHKRGLAADIVTSNFSDKDKIKLVIAASESGCGGIGIYTKKGFIHVDLGPRRSWHGEGEGYPKWAIEVIKNHRAGKYRMGDDEPVEEIKENDGPNHEEPGEGKDLKPENNKDANGKSPTATPVPKEERGTPDSPEEENEIEEEDEKVQTEENKTSSKVGKPLKAEKTATKAKSSTPGSVQSRRQDAFNFFVSKGWTKVQAAAIVGNLELESANLDPTKPGDGGEAYGLAQWHDDRQKIFRKAMGKPIKGSSFQEQLQFVDYELRNNEKPAGDKLKGAKTLESATDIVMKKYERPAKENYKSIKQRLAFAKLALKNTSQTSEETQVAKQEDTPPSSVPENPSIKTGDSTKSGDNSRTRDSQAAKESESETEDKSMAETAAEAFGIADITETFKGDGGDFTETTLAEPIIEAMKGIGKALGLDPSKVKDPKEKRKSPTIAQNEEKKDIGDIISEFWGTKQTKANGDNIDIISKSIEDNKTKVSEIKSSETPPIINVNNNNTTNKSSSEEKTLQASGGTQGLSVRDQNATMLNTQYGSATTV